LGKEEEKSWLRRVRRKRSRRRRVRRKRSRRRRRVG
jgi:hypothetical protein